MQRFLRSVYYFQVLICVTMKSKAESVYTGTEGGSVDISCKYPDEYKYSPMYFCRDPCTSSDVLIKCEKADTVISKGRYMALSTSSTCHFSVTIKHLTLKDSGVYYCGVDKWGTDKLTKVKLTVSKVPTVSTNTPGTRQNRTSNITQIPHNTSVIPSTEHNADNLTSNKQASSTPETLFLHSHDMFRTGQLFGVCGGSLGLMLCCVLVALVIFLRKKSRTHITSLKPPAPENQIPLPPPEQEELYHVYDEMLDVYSIVCPVRGDSTSTYNTIYLPASADNDCTTYSFVAPH